MKKLIVILIAVISFNAASAQQGDRDHGQYQNERNDKHYGNQGYSNDYAYNDHNRRNGDHDRRQEMDRRDNDYRYNRSMGGHERNGRIIEVERVRQQRGPSFGSGVVAGAVAGVLLGVLIAH